MVCFICFILLIFDVGAVLFVVCVDLVVFDVDFPLFFCFGVVFGICFVLFILGCCLRFVVLFVVLCCVLLVGGVTLWCVGLIVCAWCGVCWCFRRWFGLVGLGLLIWLIGWLLLYWLCGVLAVFRCLLCVCWWCDWFFVLIF